MIFNRYIESTINKLGKQSLLLLGPRQTGKSHLIERIISKDKIPSLTFRLQETAILQEIAKRPQTIMEAAESALEKGPLNLFLDEVQLVPELLNDCQSLIDRYREKIQIFLTGSSARKLRRSGANLLPGRVIFKHLHPLLLSEIFLQQKEQRICPLSVSSSGETFPYSLEEMLVYGTLPGIVLLEKELRSEMLKSYVSTYLQEEIRFEALTRKIGPFARFLELTALESGTAPNLSKLSQETGIPQSTLVNYFQILEDTLVILKLPAFGGASRKRVLTTPRYFFFDLGVRNASAGLPLNLPLLKTQAGTLFEQGVILELMRRVDYLHAGEWKCYFWRTTYGAEVDFIIDTGEELIPIEIKYSETPRNDDIKHLKTFMTTYGAKRGFLVGRFSRAQKMTESITAIPWQEI